MTHRTTTDAEPISRALESQLRELKNAPLHRRGDLAVRLMASAIVAVRDLERRVTALEVKDHG